MQRYKSGPRTSNQEVALRKMTDLNRSAALQAGNGNHWWLYQVFCEFGLYGVHRLHSTNGLAYESHGDVMFEPHEVF